MKTRPCGTSLLEIVIAMSCTALLLAVLCQCLPLARRQNREAEMRLSGALLASNALETYMTVPLKEWPRESFSVPGDGRQVRLEAAPWATDSRLVLARATVLIGQEERYQLEVLLFP